MFWDKPKGNKMSMEVYFDAWEENAIFVTKDLKPDIVVCDLNSRFGAISADQMGIPSVIIVAEPMEVLNGWIGPPDYS